MNKDQLMKFEITNDELIMKITLSNLEWLFKNSSYNMSPYGVEEFAKIIPGKRREFVEWIVRKLQEDSLWDGDNVVSWGQMFEDAFGYIFEGYEACEEFIEFQDDDYGDE